MSLLSVNENAREACENISGGDKNNIVVFNQVLVFIEV